MTQFFEFAHHKNIHDTLEERYQYWINVIKFWYFLLKRESFMSNVYLESATSAKDIRANN